MTTYGTIPTSHGPTLSSPPREFLTQTRLKIQTTLSKTKPWPTFFALHSLSFPPTIPTALSRLKLNLPYFLTNYTIITLLTLFLSLLYHPLSLITFLVTLSAWLFLYFLRDSPLVILNRIVNDTIVLVVLSGVTLGLLLLTDVTANVVVAVSVSVAVVFVHAVLRRTDDLGSGVFDDEGVGSAGGVMFSGTGGLGERMPLKDAASASYSSSS